MSPRPTVVTNDDAAKAQEAPAEQQQFETVELDIKGTHYKVREVSSKTYDRCVEMATGTDGVLDGVKLLRFIMLKAVVEPEGFDADKLGELSFTTRRKIEAVVNDIHFPPEESPDLS